VQSYLNEAGPGPFLCREPDKGSPANDHFGALGTIFGDHDSVNRPPRSCAMAPCRSSAGEAGFALGDGVQPSVGDLPGDRRLVNIR
jgi:hypothetical protein